MKIGIKPQTLWGRTANVLQKAIFPSRCYICNRFYHLPVKTMGKPLSLSGHFAQLMDRFACSACAADFIAIESPMCIQCGCLFKSREADDHFCGACLATPKRFATARAAGVYDSTLTAVIHRFKYQAKIEMSQPLGYLLWITFRQYWKEKDIDLIVAVPLHRKRLRKRGFNHAHLIIKEWCRRVPEIVKPRLPEKNILERSRPTAPQSALGSKQRLVNVKNAFRVSDGAKVSDKRILVVDDVYTTGATVNECARVLTKAGAKQVDVLTLARAV